MTTQQQAPRHGGRLAQFLGGIDESIVDSSTNIPSESWILSKSGDTTTFHIQRRPEHWQRMVLTIVEKTLAPTGGRSPDRDFQTWMGEHLFKRTLVTKSVRNHLLDHILRERTEHGAGTVTSTQESTPLPRAFRRFFQELLAHSAPASRTPGFGTRRWQIARVLTKQRGAMATLICLKEQGVASIAELAHLVELQLDIAEDAIQALEKADLAACRDGSARLTQHGHRVAAKLLSNISSR